MSTVAERDQLSSKEPVQKSPTPLPPNNEQGSPKKEKRQPVRSGRLGKVPQALLNLGFAVALLLSVTTLLLSAHYLYTFLGGTNTSINETIQKVGSNASPGTLEVTINGRLVMGRLALLSCGILVGVSFGFLGFALFLLGIKESIDVDVDTDSYKAKFARMSPGVLIIICSSILTGMCATRETPFWYENTVAIPSENSRRVIQPSQAEEVGDGQKDELINRDVPRRTDNFTKP